MRAGQSRFFSAMAAERVALLNAHPDYPGEAFYGAGWQRFFGRPKPIIEYGWADWSDTVAIRDIYRRFDEDNPLPTGLMNYTGWLSPTGVYYPCPSYGHEGRAIELTERLFYHTGGSETLVKEGWLRVSNDYILPHPIDSPYSMRQVFALMDMLPLATGRLKGTIEYALQSLGE